MNTLGGAFPNRGHLDLIIKAQGDLNRVLPLVEKAEACSVDCSEYREGIAHMQSRLDSFRREFFPDSIVPPDGSGVPKMGG